MRHSFARPSRLSSRQRSPRTSRSDPQHRWTVSDPAKLLTDCTVVTLDVHSLESMG